MESWKKKVVLETMEDLDEDDLEEVLKEGHRILKNKKNERTPPRTCLFCDDEDDTKAILQHMASAHEFSIPDQEYCFDIDGLLDYLWAKIMDGKCIACSPNNNEFEDVWAAQEHMKKNGHCKMRLNTDTSLNYGPYYDFCAKFRKEGTEISDLEIYGTQEDDDNDDDDEITWAKIRGKKRLVKCSKCGTELYIKDKSKHVKRAHDPANAYRCNFCNTKWKSQLALDIHKGHIHTSSKNREKLSKNHDYAYEVPMSPIYKFGKLYGVTLGLSSLTNFRKHSMYNRHCSKTELTARNGYTIAHERSMGTGITGNNRDEMDKCKNYARRCIVHLAKRASVRSNRKCLELSTERKQEIKERLSNIPLLSPYVVDNPFWIDEGDGDDDEDDEDVVMEDEEMEIDDEFRQREEEDEEQWLERLAEDPNYDHHNDPHNVWGMR